MRPAPASAPLNFPLASHERLVITERVSPGFMLIALLFVLLVLLGVLSRANELFAGRFDRGSFRLERGRCPAALVHAIEDVARLERLDSVTLSVRSSSGSPRVTASGNIDDGQLQQLRNVVGRFEVAQIRRGRRRA